MTKTRTAGRIVGITLLCLVLVSAVLGMLGTTFAMPALDDEPLHQLPATNGRVSYFASDDGHTGVCDPAAWGELLGEECGMDDATKYWYCAMRWPYVNASTDGELYAAKAWWHNKKILVSNPRNGKQVILAAKDWGPAEWTGRVIDVSPTALCQLGASTDDTVDIEFADQDAALGVVSTSGCDPYNYQCGTETDDCYCGASNPCYCCDNDYDGDCLDPCDGNCPWWAWQEACCNWGRALEWCTNANTWADQAQYYGYPVSDVPAVNTIAAKTSGSYGHVAWVIEVTGDHVRVREMNCCEVSPSCVCSGEPNANCQTCGPANPDCPSLGDSVRSCTYSLSFFDKYIYDKGSPIPPPPPKLISPGLDSYPGPTISTLTPTFQWTSVATADYYGLYIRDLDADVLVFDSDVHYGPIYGTSFPLPDGYLDHGTHYRWNMNSYNSAGWGGYSDRLWFMTGADTIKPTVDAFDVSPDSVCFGGEFTISYTVSDTGGSGLKQAELWRAIDVNGDGKPDWDDTPNPVQVTPIPGGDSYTDNFYDSTFPEDSYWYGIHAVDNAGNWAPEDSPIKVEVEDCDDYDGCYVYGTGCEDRDYYCLSGSCTYTHSNRHTDYHDGWVYYCSGDTVRRHKQFHDFYCSSGTCTDHPTWVDDQLVDNCNNYDGWVDTGETKWVPDTPNECREKEQKGQEYWDYYCSGSSCTHSVTDNQWVDTGNKRDRPDGTDCGTDYYGDWVHYCNGDEVWKHQQFHDFYCSSGTCTDHPTWVDDQLVDNCNDYDGWVDTGETKWVPDTPNECREKEQKEQEYWDYYCSGGSCTHSVTDNQWVDTGNKRNKAEAGDANMDGEVNMQDVTYTELIILGYEGQTCGADCNQDSVVNMGDVTCIELRILGYLVDLTVESDGCCPIDVGDPVKQIVAEGQTRTFFNIFRDTDVTVYADDSDPCCVFDSWSDGGAQTHDVHMDGDKSVTATCH